VRRGEGRFAEMGGGVRWDRMTPYDLGDAGIIMTTYQPGALSADELYRHDGRETHIVVEGRIVVEVGFDRFELAIGASLTFASSQPHRYSNPYAETARGITVLLGLTPRDDSTGS